MLAVTQFIELPSLRAQNSPEVMCRLTLHNGAARSKLVDEESPAHAQILSHLSAVSSRLPAEALA
jgi:hypothetical protein